LFAILTSLLQNADVKKNNPDRCPIGTKRHRRSLPVSALRKGISYCTFGQSQTLMIRME
jgi:hypothetical protein